MSAVAEAAATLRSGGLVVYPTETVYGIGTVLSAGEEGIARLRAAKGSPSGRPFVLLAASTEAGFALWSELPAFARELAAAAWPGPVTLVGPARSGLPSGLIGTAADGRRSLAVRVPGDAWLLGLLDLLGEPLLSTSANLAGGPPPAGFGEVALGALAPDLAIDRGPCEGGTPSTVISLMGLQPEVLRPGAWEPPSTWS